MRTAALRILEHVRVSLPFLSTGIVLWLGTRQLAPWLESLGAPRAVAFSTGLYLPFGVLAPTAAVLSEFPGLGAPTTFPAPFDPTAPFALLPSHDLGTPLKGAGWLALVAIAAIV